MKKVMKIKNLNLLTAVVLTAGGLPINYAVAQMDMAENVSPQQHKMSQMQGGGAPVNARNPHAYSDGFSLTDGPYAQLGPRQLKLADEHAFWAVMGDRFEYLEDSESTTYDLQAWYGVTFDRFVVKAEGDIKDGALEESSTDLLWGHALNANFDTQFGIRFDQYKEGKGRQWLALGVQGLAPYWFELDVTAYLGDGGRTALAAEAEYELLLTQRLILQPRAELSIYGRDDSDNGVGSGLSDMSVGLRLRYEFDRQFAPYIGVEQLNTFGDTADYRQADGESRSETQASIGLRFWF